jgi:hypothetical protein
MKTTRKSEYGSPDYGCPPQTMTGYAYFGKGAEVYGYIGDDIVYGVCTGGQRGDAFQGENPEVEIKLHSTGEVVWVNEDAFANPPKED